MTFILLSGTNKGINCERNTWDAKGRRYIFICFEEVTNIFVFLLLKV